MICLTGDLHHASLRTGNQRRCDRSEIAVARLYLDMLREANVKATFFISGRSFAEEWETLRPVCDNPLVEIGGHNYSCFTPAWWHRAWKKLTGDYNGPLWQQRRDAIATRDIIARRAGRRVRCWRNHMYMHGPHTERVLADAGILICSDGVRRDSIGPTRHAAGVWNFPLNVMPDHEHLYHAERTPEYVRWFTRRYQWRDDYGSESYHVEEWTDRVVDELRRHEADGIVSNMLIHPITLYLCDRFRSFRRILDLLASAETAHMSEAASRWQAADPAASRRVEQEAVS